VPDCPPPPTERTARTRLFEVGTTFGTIAGSGQLIVAPGSVTLVPGYLSRRLWNRVEAPYRQPPEELECVGQSKPTIEVLKARFLPPWMNTAAVVEGDRETAVAVVPAWLRRSVLEALAEAGFVVHVTRTSFYIAGDRAGPT
jgi:hypothetical protein